MKIRNTHIRKIMLEFFRSNNERHFNAMEVHSMLTKDGHSIGIASIYRNLDLLYKIGYIRRYRFGNSYVYEYCKSAHHHIVCSNGRIIDFELSDREKAVIGRIKQRLEREYSIEINGYELKFISDGKEKTIYKEEYYE